jgi:hypothetical protein
MVDLRPKRAKYIPPTPVEIPEKLESPDDKHSMSDDEGGEELLEQKRPVIPARASSGLNGEAGSAPTPSDEGEFDTVDALLGLEEDWMKKKAREVLDLVGRFTQVQIGSEYFYGVLDYKMGAQIFTLAGAF